MNLKFETINFEIIENIAIIHLNRPNSYNSLNAKMAKELLEISYECDTNKKIRAIILTGEGDRAFCAGGDLKSFHETGNVAKHLKMVTHDLHGAITKFSRMNSPLIVAVNGVAAGAGLSFVGFADVCINGMRTSEMQKSISWKCPADILISLERHVCPTLDRIICKHL